MTNKEKTNILMEFIRFRMEMERKLKDFEKVISGGNNKLELDALLNVLEDSGFFKKSKKKSKNK